MKVYIILVTLYMNDYSHEFHNTWDNRRKFVAYGNHTSGVYKTRKEAENMAEILKIDAAKQDMKIRAETGRRIDFYKKIEIVEEHIK